MFPSQFMHSVKLLTCVLVLFCYLLASVSHSADTSVSIEELPISINTNDSPSLPEIDPEVGAEEEIQTTEAEHNIEHDTTKESTNDPIEIGLAISSESDEQKDPVKETHTDSSVDSTDTPEPETDTSPSEDIAQNDFLQLPTMDEFITQNQLKPDSLIQSPNGATSPDPLPPSSSTDSLQTPSLSNTNSVELSPSGHETPPKQKNYASADCGAKIIARNPESRNAGGILNENRDDYMLNKCSLEAVWVTVELCDYIQVLSIELAVHELFSSLPENFSISLSLQGGVKPEDWLPPTLFAAKNVRGDQTFRVPAAEQHHARFVKLTFMSHYGSEHYCPITTLRVLGANYVEVLEAIERGSVAQTAPAEASLSLDTEDSEQSQKGARPSEGFFTNALDGIYKFVWPEGEQLSTVNITEGETAIDISEDAIEANNDSATESPREAMKIGLEQRESSVIGKANASSVTELADKNNDTISQSSIEIASDKEPRGELNSTLDTNLREQTNESSNNNNNNNKTNTNTTREGISSTLSENKQNASNHSDSGIHESLANTETQTLGPVSPTATEEGPELPNNTVAVGSAQTSNDSTHPQSADNSSLPDPSSSPKEPPVPLPPPASQNYLVRMQERIARLGENVTLIHRYLDQFRHSIQRNVNRTEEVQRSLERKLSQLESLVNLTLLNVYIQSEGLEGSEAYWAESVAGLRYEIQVFKLQILFGLLVLLVFVLLIAVFVSHLNTHLRREMSSLSLQFNKEIQKVLRVVSDDQNNFVQRRQSALESLSIPNQENEDFEYQQTDKAVLSDSHLNAFGSHAAKKKKKIRKTQT